MARYIDADALIKKMFPLGIGDGMYVINAKAVKFAIDNTPAADVVPKSEVDLYRKQVDELEDELASTYDKLENAKADVAKIFAEIGNILDQWIQLYYTISVSTFDSIEQVRAGASESALRAFIDYVDELKKKYTEEKTNAEIH